MKNDWYKDFDLNGIPTGGGNANVYFVKEKRTGQKYALKELKNWNNKSTDIRVKETKKRFINEIDIAKENANEIAGIIPIVKSCETGYWYTMPIAEPIIKYTENKDIEEIVIGVMQLAETLVLLHAKGICHRDIKPANIYFYNDRFSFGDFGLVDFPDNSDDFTRCNKGLGAIFTIAPEMKRNPKDADGRKADVFSLAKTMWMLLTKDEKGFDGVYNYLDKSHSLRFVESYKSSHLVEIDELLRDATANDPYARPTMKEFGKRLEGWLEICSDTYKSQSSDWNFLNKLLFGSNPPDSCVWREPKKIVDVLNAIGLTPAFNHMLFSDKGGLDFSYAEMAHEAGCIKVYDTSRFCHILKPKNLYYEGFDQKVRWNYFLLEIDEIDPVFETHPLMDHEYLVEDRPAHYVSAQFADYGVYDYEKGNPLPKGYQKVYRYIKGKFLIVMKTGPYNGINGTYDGRHGDCSSNEFKNYITKLIKLQDKFYEVVKQNEQWNHLSDEDIEDKFSNLKELNKNPFKHAAIQNDNTVQIKQRFAEEKKSKAYIAKNFKTWNFQDVLKSNMPEESIFIKFAFEFNNPNESFSLEKFYGENNYITVDGNIKKLNSALNENCYCVYDRKTVIALKDVLENRVAQILKENNLVELEKYETCFSITLVKMGKPAHLFTKETIKEAMRSADDRVNNQLVIDENGYAKVIQDKGYGYLYPVRHESWNAGNIYVGKYSKLLSLDDDYIASLQGWLSYLKTGRKQYMDCVMDSTNEKELIEEIKMYY
ncbi:MAG: protein kinase family protein [Christensenellaceae bacterium]